MWCLRLSCLGSPMVENDTRCRAVACLHFYVAGWRVNVAHRTLSCSPVGWSVRKGSGRGNPNRAQRCVTSERSTARGVVSSVASHFLLSGLAAYDRVEDLAFATEVGHGDVDSVQHAAAVSGSRPTP